MSIPDSSSKPRQEGDFVFPCFQDSFPIILRRSRNFGRIASVAGRIRERGIMKGIRFLTGFILVIVSVAAPSSAAAKDNAHKTENVIFVMTDGFRWQEMFEGAGKALIHAPDTKNGAALNHAFWRSTPEERREALLPFVWGVMAKQGQVFGNRNKESDARVTNGLKFSYPGYQEILCGYPDPRIDTNDAPPNANVTVLEWLNRKPAYRGRVAAFAAWDAFDRIFNRDRCGFLVNAGFSPLTGPTVSPQIEILNRLKQEIPRQFDEEPVDALTFHTAFEYFKAARPRVLYLSLGETDDWAHMGRYDEYLSAAHRFDGYLRRLWDTAQSMPEYRGRTTLIVSTDHGRGSGPSGWRDHGKDVKDAEFIWMGYLGPDTPALGERANVAAVTQGQVASTLAALLGEDYSAAVPKAVGPIADVLGNPGLVQKKTAFRID
jgi:hypothetical protein